MDTQKLEELRVAAEQGRLIEALTLMNAIEWARITTKKAGR